MADVSPETFPHPPRDLPATDAPQSVVLAGGCFWCTEGVLERVPGVLDVTSGYTGGDAHAANYDAVCSGRTGHAEVVRVTYDPRIVTLGGVLRIFFAVAHDPTQLDRQGNDVGTQYRSAVFTDSNAQRDVVQAYIHTIDAAKVFDKPVVTTVEPLTTFHQAEPYHQDFMVKNPAQPYVCAVGVPKVRKLDAFVTRPAV